MLIHQHGQQPTTQFRQGWGKTVYEFSTTNNRTLTICIRIPVTLYRNRRAFVDGRLPNHLFNSIGSFPFSQNSALWNLPLRDAARGRMGVSSALYSHRREEILATTICEFLLSSL